MQAGFSLRATTSRSVKNGRWGAYAPTRMPATAGRTAPMLFSTRLKRRCNGGDVVTERRCNRGNDLTPGR